MDDYGIEVVNRSGTTTISNVYKMLVYSERGSFRIQSQYTDRPGYGYVTFARPVTAQEPPSVFLRTASASHSSITIYTTILGGPGNWTGFKITSGAAGGGVLQNHLMEYVCCKYSDLTVSPLYGIEIKDSANRVSFSSSDRLVRYNKFSKNWTLATSTFMDVYSSNLAIESDDYICVSSMDRGVSWFVNQWMYVGLVIFSGGVQALRITNQKTQGDNYYQGTNGTCFAIPVCKFPISRYYG